MKKLDNYAAFYALLKRMPGATKEQLVAEFSGGRTTSLREMKSQEYRTMIWRMQQIVNKGSENLKKMRSGALHQLQLLGINTADWSEVNRYVSQSRIAGKVFASLSIEDLRELTKKLRAIKQKKDAEMRAQLLVL